VEEKHGGEFLSASILNSRSIQSQHFGSIHSFEGIIMKWYNFWDR